MTVLSVTRALFLAAFSSGSVFAQSNAIEENNAGSKMSCLSIFIVCSWKCVHLNIPTHEEIHGGWHTLHLCKYLPDISIWPKKPLRRKWCRKILWMTGISIAPELGVALAAKQYMEAREELKKGQRSFRFQEYTMAHAFYVRMGGIVIYSAGARTLPQYKASFTQSLLELDNKLKMHECEIKDLSKADVITKAFAITQCTWLILQTIARHIQGYAISQLELATLAFIFCAIIMHICWWNKPFDVETRRVIVGRSSNETVSSDMALLSMDDLAISDQAIIQERIADIPKGTIANLLFFNIPGILGSSFKECFPSYALYISAIGFIAIHLAAWNWEFPSTLTKCLWRWFNLGALIAFVLPVALSTLYFSIDCLEMVLNDPTMEYIFVISFVTYIIARLMVLGLTFYSLSSMPRSAYYTIDWLAWVPHFS